MKKSELKLMIEEVIKEEKLNEGQTETIEFADLPAAVQKVMLKISSTKSIKSVVATKGSYDIKLDGFGIEVKNFRELEKAGVLMVFDNIIYFRKYDLN